MKKSKCDHLKADNIIQTPDASDLILIIDQLNNIRVEQSNLKNLVNMRLHYV